VFKHLHAVFAELIKAMVGHACHKLFVFPYSHSCVLSNGKIWPHSWPLCIPRPTGNKVRALSIGDGSAADNAEIKNIVSTQEAFVE
jgi:hypothetical protein